MRSRLFCLEMGVSIILILGALESSHAAEFFCSSGNVTCLITAINAANGNKKQNTITLETGDYVLNAKDNSTLGPTGLPLISSGLTIRGAGADFTSVLRGDGAPVFRILGVSSAGNLTLDGLTIRGGIADFTAQGDVGGGILNDGITSIVNAAVVHNSATGLMGARGAALFNNGTLTVTNSTIANNGAFHGGGSITNQGSMTIRKSSIMNNDALDGSAGGIINGGILDIIDSVVASNNAIDNVAGGISNFGTMTIRTSTVANNHTNSDGGGIVNSGILTINGATIARNSANGPPRPGSRIGGILGGGIITLQNTILARNTSDRLNNQFGEFATDCSGPITSLGNNLIGDLQSCIITLQPSDLTGDPGLADFVDDGAPGGGYFPLLAGSRAINGGNPDACPPTDQLGLSRLGNCDIGSVEFQGSRMLVSIDVRPRGDANKINPNNIKDINVAIFSVNGFDATIVDSTSVRFGATGSEAAPVHVARRDVDGDGHRDMVVRFQIQDTGIRCGDISAALTGQTSSGLSFIGSSPITTTGCKPEHRTVAVGSR